VNAAAAGGVHTCAACGAVAAPRRVKQLVPELAVIRCAECHVLALHPMPTPQQIQEHYDRYYLTRTSSDDSVERLIRMHGPIAEWLLARLDGSRANRVLDYGFGSGAVLVQMARRGQRAYGADLSTQNVRQLGEYAAKHSLDIELRDLSRQSVSDFGGVQFDLITLFQVIEHLTEPLAQLRQLAAHQGRGALIYLECPNDPGFLSWSKRFTRVTPIRKYLWNSMRWPEHLHGFGRRSMARMLEAAGYQVEELGDYAYRDGLHQVEAELWWPRFRDNPNPLSLRGLTRSAIPLADKLLSAGFGSGSGLYALARKVA